MSKKNKRNSYTLQEKIELVKLNETISALKSKKNMALINIHFIFGKKIFQK